MHQAIVTPPAYPTAKHGLPATLPKRMGRALRGALPSSRAALFGALAWAVAMGASALANLFSYDWQTATKIRFVALLFAAAGALAFPVGLYFARLFSAGRNGQTAFAAAFVSLAIFTAAFTSGFFALQYRFYYAEWHAPAFSITWGFQFAFTGAAALYQFAVLGVRLYFPIGFIALILASLWFARQPR
jgi:hypothetical protein